MRRGLLLWVLLTVVATPARGDAPPADAPGTTTVAGEGFNYLAVAYLANRTYDLFDLVRARVRLGPGVALGVRLTRPLSGLVGRYRSVYAGVPGPRGEPRFPAPVGREANARRPERAWDALPEPPDPWRPHYGPTELGAGAQLGLVGFDLGVDPLEWLDLAFGFLLIDLVGDDY